MADISTTSYFKKKILFEVACFCIFLDLVDITTSTTEGNNPADTSNLPNLIKF